MLIKKIKALLLSGGCGKTAFFLLISGMVAGVVLWEFFLYSLEVTGTTEFCTSCHSMQSYIYERYEKSVHFKNAEGIQADCADCHIPKPLGAKLIRKTIGLKDVYHKFIGTIDSEEKYLARRPELTERVRARMRARDSQECRNCHNFNYMDIQKQSSAAQRQHSSIKQSKKTCVDCHQGVGHPSITSGTNNSEEEESFSLE